MLIKMVHKLFTLNIRKYLVNQPRTKRRNKAIKFIRNRIAHYTKMPLDAVKIDQTLNSMIIKFNANSMKKVKVDANIENNKVKLTPIIEAKKLKPKIVNKFRIYEKLQKKSNTKKVEVKQKSKESELKKKDK